MGETRTSQHLPNDVLRELHGFIHMFEDTPGSWPGTSSTEARSYLDGLAPPFFKALMDYAQDGSYSWHCRGTAAAWPSESQSARCSTSSLARTCCAPTSAMRWKNWANCWITRALWRDQRKTPRVSSMPTTASFDQWHLHLEQDGVAPPVAPGDVVVDRNYHKSNLHAIIMCGCDPSVPHAHAQSLRDHRSHPAASSAPTRSAPRLPPTRCSGVDPETVQPSILTLTQSTYDGVLYNTEVIKQSSTAMPTLHFDEAWLPHAAFHDFYGQFHAMGKNRPRPKDHGLRHAEHAPELLAGISQASQVLVQDSQTVKLDKHLFNEAYLMHTSTSPQYSIIASCDVAAAMMEPRGTALVEESIRESLISARHAQGGRGLRRRLVVQGLGPRQAAR